VMKESNILFDTTDVFQNIREYIPNYARYIPNCTRDNIFSV
jgi:hypothetical protein